MHRIKAYESRFEKDFEDMTEMPEYEEAMFTKFGNQTAIPNGKVVLDFTLLCPLSARQFPHRMHHLVRSEFHAAEIGAHGRDAFLAAVR